MRIRVVFVVAAAIVICAAGVLLVGFGASPDPVDSCPPGRACVPEAGISLALPDGWTSWTPEADGGGDVFAAGVSPDSSKGIVVTVGLDDLDGEAPTDLNDLEASFFNDRIVSDGFVMYDDVVSDRVALPIGEALRLRYGATTNFILIDNFAMTEYWCFVNGNLIEIAYVEDFGEGDLVFPSTLPPEVGATIESIQTLNPRRSTTQLP